MSVTLQAPPLSPTENGTAPLNGAYELDPDVIPNLDNIIVQDDTPVESVFIEKQHRLYTSPLYISWAGPGEGKGFLALANVGLFHTYGQPPLVPDAMLALDVVVDKDLQLKENRSYFVWIRGKVPDVVIEDVSDQRGGEADYKMRAYARVGVTFYVIHDPEHHLSKDDVRAFVLQRGRYVPTDPRWFPEVGLGLKLWTGVFEGAEGTWLRWCDKEGNVILTGEERLQATTQQLSKEEERSRRLEAQLRAAGVEPEK